MIWNWIFLCNIKNGFDMGWLSFWLIMYLFTRQSEYHMHEKINQSEKKNHWQKTLNFSCSHVHSVFMKAELNIWIHIVLNFDRNIKSFVPAGEHITVHQMWYRLIKFSRSYSGWYNGHFHLVYLFYFEDKNITLLAS